MAHTTKISLALLLCCVSPLTYHHTHIEYGFTFLLAHIYTYNIYIYAYKNYRYVYYTNGSMCHSGYPRLAKSGLVGDHHTWIVPEPASVSHTFASNLANVYVADWGW